MVGNVSRLSQRSPWNWNWIKEKREGVSVTEWGKWGRKRKRDREGGRIRLPKWMGSKESQFAENGMNTESKAERRAGENSPSVFHVSIPDFLSCSSIPPWILCPPSLAPSWVCHYHFITWPSLASFLAVLHAPYNFSVSAS